MNIGGTAYNEEALEARYKAFKEVEHLHSHITLKRSPEYGKTCFSGELKTNEVQELSEYQLALLVSAFPFGGYITKDNEAKTFSGYWFID